MTPTLGLEALKPHLCKRFLVDTLLHLVKVPTDVPLGPQTLIAPDHPKLVHYVQNVLRPLMTDAGIYNVMEAPLNQLVVREGTGETDESLLIMAYTPSQHQNFTKDPFVPRIAIPYEHGYTEPCIYGQGVTQNKVHQAAMITVLKAMAESGVRLRGTLYFGVNNEGRSSHACSDALIPLLEPRPRYGIVLIGTGFDISVGNRGRVDVYVHVHGRPCHSSAPWEGLNAIEGATEAINRIRAMKFTKTHPLLGGQHAVAYQVVYDPVAPHTLPGYAKITVDRRLLPGDDIDQAVTEVREAVGDLSPFKVTVERGVHMLPALVDEDAPIVTRLAGATAGIRGRRPDLKYQPGSYDAGGPCAWGIPTVQWGASGGLGLLGDDFMPVQAAWDETMVLAKIIAEWLG